MVSLSDYRDSTLSPLRSGDLSAQAQGFADNPFAPLFRRRIGELAEESGGVFGISLAYLGQALCAFALAACIRDLVPDARIVLGGSLVTSWVRQGSLDPSSAFGGLFDAILPGGDRDVVDDLVAICSGGGGGGGGRAGTEVGTGGRGGNEAENLRPRGGDPLPEYGDFAEHSYFAPVRIIPHAFSSGCGWRRCTFCPETAEGNPYLCEAPDRIPARLGELERRYRPGLFHFTDNEIPVPVLRVLASDPPGVPWYGFARFSGVLADPGFCHSLAEGGCVLLQLGLESGDQSVLDRLRKGTNLDLISRILGNLAAAGIATYLYVLFGTPAEDRRSALATQDFLERHADAVGFLNVALFSMPVSGTEAKSLGTTPFYEGDLSLYCDFAHPRGWDRQAVRAYIGGEFRGTPGVHAALLRTPPVFTSNHAVFFTPGWRFRGTRGSHDVGPQDGVIKLSL